MNIKRQIKFNLNPYGKNTKFFQIRIIVSYNGMRTFLSTGCTIRSKDAWDEELCHIKKGYHSVKGITSEVQNRDLARANEVINDCFKLAELQRTIPSLESLREYYNENYLKKIKIIDTEEDVEIKEDTHLTFWQIYNEFVISNGEKNAWSDATYEKFAALKSDLLNFKKDLTFNDFNEKGLTKFVCYLRDKKVTIPAKSTKDENGNWKGKKEGLSNATIKKKLGFLNWFLKWATVKGFNTNLEYQGFRINLKTTSKVVIFLNKEELIKIQKLELPPEKHHLERVRDIFLFCCFSGIRYSDAYNLRKADIKDSKIMITTQKTADSLTIELNNVTKKILEKYKDVHIPDNKALPVPANQPMNRWLKELAEMAGIDESIRLTTYKGNKRIDQIIPKYKLIGTHTARRTFICQALSMGTPADVVMKWTGHSDYKSMRPYIDIVDKVKEIEMTKMNSLLEF